jgi:hypothetical protein
MGLFGIGDGKMELQLKSPNVSSGETLEGTATLTLNKDVKGKSVVAILYAERTETTHGANGSISKRNIKIYSRSVDLDTEKLYTKAGCPYQYKFSFVIPQTGVSTPKAASSGMKAVESILGAVGGVSGLGSGLVRWYVKAELNHEAMLTFPIAKTQEINIVVPSQQQAGSI